MTPVYPSARIIEYHNGTTWVDISADVVTNLVCKDGFTTSRPDDRVSMVGYMTFSLNNADEKYSPMGGDTYHGLSTLTGFNKGAKLRVTLQYEDESKVIFTGRLDTIRSDSGTWGERRVDVVAVTWMNIAGKFPMAGSNFLTNSTMDDGIRDILSRMPIQPESTDISVGDYTFPTIFDLVKTKTKATAEFTKLSISELGYIYIELDGTLRVENSSNRLGSRIPLEIPIASGLSDHFVTEEEEFDFVTEEEGFYFVVEDSVASPLRNTMTKLDLTLENDQLNRVGLRAYPRRTDTSAQILAKINTPMTLAVGVATTFKLSYADPNGGKPINGTSMITPVATTDYLLNRASDGSSTDYTANLTVAVTFYGDLAEITLTPSTAITTVSQVYLTKFQLQGYGVYVDNPIEIEVTDIDSVSTYGEIGIDVDQKYQTTTDVGNQFALSTIQLNKTPRTKIKGAEFIANTSSAHMMSFLNTDVGTLLELYDNRSQLSNYYYVAQRSYSISLGGVITFSIRVAEAPSIASGAFIGVKTSYLLGALDFGYVSKLSNLTKRSISSWIYLVANSGVTGVIESVIANGLSGHQFALGGTNQLQWYQKGTTSVGSWLTPNNSISATGSWHHVVATRDTTNPLSDPFIYIDGVSQTLTISSNPVGAVADESGLPFKIGNLAEDAFQEDTRVYNKILSQAEVTTLYNAGHSGGYSLVVDGLVFQAPAVRVEDASLYNSRILRPNDMVYDNMNQLVGQLFYPLSQSWALRTTPNVWYLDTARSDELELFVAVGQGVVASSYSGKYWTSRTSPSAGNFNGVCWSAEKGLFVAVGQNLLATSATGTSWTLGTMATGTWQDVTYSPELDLFAAIGTNVLATSPDGTTWTHRSFFAATWKAIIWCSGLGMFVAVSYGDTYAYSTDGITWYNGGAMPNGDGYFGLAYDPVTNTVVAVGTNGKISHSTGSTLSWSRVVLGSAIDCFSVVWSPEFGIFMATGQNGTAGYGTISSPDGVSWTNVATPADWAWGGISYSPNLRRFVAVQGATSNTTRVMLY